LPGDLAATDRIFIQAVMADVREMFHMDFELTDEQELIREAVREFADADVAGARAL
jgi:hypothetical protein